LVVQSGIVIEGVLGRSLPLEFAELIARRFSALGEPTRIRLLDLLTHRGELSVGELAKELGASHANISKHLNMLYAERIVGRRKLGTRVLYRVVDERVIELCQVVCGSLRTQLDELGLLLEPPDAAVPARAGAAWQSNHDERGPR
jgi:DNA-binding transcriptional ArsR family regulator